VKKIVHIINADRFTSGYINYMEIVMKEFNHFFICLKSRYQLKLFDYTKLYEIKSYKEIVFSKQIISMLESAEKIIISGIFNIEKNLFFLPSEILSKTSLHFWGGDFYQFENPTTIKKSIQKKIMYSVIKRCDSVIFLIDGEYQKFESIFNINKKYYIAAMPYNPIDQVDYSNVKNKIKQHPHRILVGNSATESNHHMNIFELVKKYREIYSDFEVVCPLSYGSESYRKYILQEGTKLLGKSFIPILNAMNLDEYVDLLATCSVAVFNNDRQQAMGNINQLLYLGRKVYIRQDTSMWDSYNNRGFVVNSIEKLVRNNGNFLFDINYNEMKKNEITTRKYFEHRTETFIKQWEEVLNSQLKR